MKMRLKVAQAVIDFMEDSSWRTAQDIADATGLPYASIYGYLRAFEPSSKYQFRLERMGVENPKVPKKFRFVKIKNQVVSKRYVQKYAHEFRPIIEDLIKALQKDRVSISHSYCLQLASMLRNVLDRVVTDVASSQSVEPIDIQSVTSGKHNEVES